MRRTSVDQDPVGQPNDKESVKHQPTLSNIGMLPSQMSNGQSVSASDVSSDGPSQHLELKKSDVDVKSVSVGASLSFGGSSPVQPGNDFDPQKTRSTIANLHRKINHTMELIKLEQNAQAENVNEYLESVKLDKPNLQQIKSIFEKKNQKSTQNIMQLQSKLEMYQKRLAEVQLHGVTGPKEVLKNVSQGLKTMVSKPMELAAVIKHKLGSVDNVNTGVNDVSKDSAEDSDALLSLNIKSLPGSNRSTDNTMPSADGAYVGQDSTGQQPRLNPLHSLKGGAVQSDKSLAQALQALQVESNKLRNGITNLKVQVHSELADMKQTLELERDICDRLEEQINDLTELHQHEMSELKLEMSSLEEKLQYTLDDRTRDLHELLESCLQRVTKVEQQQHQQLIQTEIFENSGFSIAKIINFILAFLSFCLILLSTLASLVSPFLSTRLRYILTFCFVICFAFAWKNWDFVSSIASSLASSYLMPLLPAAFSSSNTHSSQERNTSVKLP